MGVVVAAMMVVDMVVAAAAVVVAATLVVVAAAVVVVAVVVLAAMVVVAAAAGGVVVATGVLVTGEAEEEAGGGGGLAVEALVVTVVTLIAGVEVPSAKANEIGHQKFEKEVVLEAACGAVDDAGAGISGEEVATVAAAVPPTTFQRKVMPTRVILPAGLKSGGKNPPQ